MQKAPAFFSVFFMPIEQVKLYIKKLKCPIPENLKRERGKIGLYRGKFARVEIWTSKKKPLCLCRNVNGKTVHTFYGLDEITLANDTARRYEIQGKENGQSFGTISDDEKTALIKWRDYVFSEIKAGKPAPSLSEVIGAMIEREQTKGKTPAFDKVALEFIEHKERAAAITYEYEKRLRSRLKALSKIFKGVPLAEIDETKIFAAINKAIKKNTHRNAAPALKTVKHYLELTKELFKWYYTRENAQRRPHEKLSNPLELVIAPAIRTKDENEPATLTPAQTRQTLSAINDNAPQLIPAAVFQLFCGVRNAEALRLRWRDIQESTLYLSRKITKTSEARAVPIPANALAWINAYRATLPKAPAPESLIFCGKDTTEKELSAMDSDTRARVEYENLHSRLNSFHSALRKIAKTLAFPLEKNVFRHTGASALAAIYGNSRAADYCGHSKAIASKHYRNPFSLQEAQDYFGTMPPQSGKPAIVFDRSRKRVLLADINEDSRPASAST